MYISAADCGKREYDEYPRAYSMFIKIKATIVSGTC